MFQSKRNRILLDELYGKSANKDLVDRICADIEFCAQDANETLDILLIRNPFQSDDHTRRRFEGGYFAGYFHSNLGFFYLYDPEKGRLFTWMINIARRLAIDQLRSKSYRKSLVTQELSGDENICVPLDTVYNKIDQAILRTAARSLRAEEQAVLSLIYDRGFTHVEAAQQLGIPLGTVKRGW